MKKIYVVYALLLIVMLSGCGRGSSGAVSSLGGSSSTSASTSSSGGSSSGNSGGILPVANTPVDARIIAALNIYSFGQVTIGSASAPVTIQLTNVGNGPAVMGAVLIPVPFRLVAESCPDNLPAGASCQLQVTYNPTPSAAGDVNVQAAIEYNGRREFFTTLVGGSLTPARFVAESANFGNLYAGNTTGVANVRITNTGQTAGVPQINYTGHGNFPIYSHATCAGSPSLAPGSSCYFQVRATLAANTIGAVSARIARVTSPDGGISDSMGSVNGVSPGAIPLYRKIRHVPGFQQSYLVTRDPNEANGAYNLEGQLTAIFDFPFNANCSILLYRGYVVTAPGRAHHMVSQGGESITYDGPLGYACNTPLPYASRSLERFFYNNGAGGIWIETAHEPEKKSLRAVGFVSHGIVGWLP